MTIVMELDMQGIRFVGGKAKVKDIKDLGFLNATQINGGESQCKK